MKKKYFPKKCPVCNNIFQPYHANGKVTQTCSVKCCAELRKSFIPWNKGTKGICRAWNKGIPASEESKQHLRELNIGKKLSSETKNKISIGCSKPRKNRGQPWSEKRRLLYPRKPVKMRDAIYSENWHDIRKKIYARDKWKCRQCGCVCPGNDTKDKIQCHHVDYNTKNNNFNNLITLCISCHSKTKKDKDKWTSYFISKIQKER